MAEWAKVKLASQCQPPATDGEILLPDGTEPPSGRRVLVECNNNRKLLQAGVRAEAGGKGACVSAATLRFFGGHDVAVRYRGLSFVGVLVRDRWLAAQFLTSVLTLTGAGITAYSSFINDSGDDASDFANRTAFIALLIAFATATLAFIKDYRDV